MANKKEMTAPGTSVGADDGQSLNISENSIPENSLNFNNPEEDFKKSNRI